MLDFELALKLLCLILVGLPIAFFCGIFIVSFAKLVWTFADYISDFIDFKIRRKFRDFY